MAKHNLDNRLTPVERRASGALAAVFGLRMLGLFLIMPVIAIYGQHYPDYTPILIGLAIGAYGLTQALFQIPLGILSDRIGRRPVIITGLLIFAVGSLVAAWADTLVGVIIGRALQGMGAIAAAILALAADITRDSQRSKVMATIGLCIGLSFALALVLGPLLGAQIGLAGLFYFTAVSALLGIVILQWAVPKVAQKAARGDLIPLRQELSQLFTNPQLARLNIGVLVLHCVLTAFFVVVPLQLIQGGLVAERHAWLYLPTLFASFALMVPMLIKAERQRRHPQFFRIGILLLMIAVTVIVFVPAHWMYLAVAVILFFTGFNLLEASLPSSLTRFAPAGNKGGASGIYSTFQFLGAFLGGALGGVIMQYYGLLGVGVFCLILLLFWFVVSFGMLPPPQQQSVSYPVPKLTAAEVDGVAEQLSHVVGVEEVRVVAVDQTVYLKVHKTDYNEEQVKAYLSPYQ